MEELLIRAATPGDAEEMLAIYAPYVENTAITFEYETPSPREFRRRIAETLEKYPWLAAEIGGRVVGYAYAGPFKARAAYDWAAELTVYLAPEVTKRGVGRLLYAALEDELRRMGVVNLYACIGYPEIEDEYLTRNSADFHSHMGYSLAGRFHKCGFKFGRWYDMIWMEKLIGGHSADQPPIKPFAP